MTTTAKKFRTIEEIKTAHRNAGGFFFSPGAMHSFRSRILSQVYGGRYFVVSKQFVDSRGRKDRRKYFVCEITEERDILTVKDGDNLSQYYAKKLARQLGEENA